jgi:CBS domain-containing protein
MTENVVCLPADATIREAVDDWFLTHRFEAFPVCGMSGLEGMFSLDAARRLDRSRWEQITVREAMDENAARDPASPDEDAMEILARMSEGGLACLPVVEDGRLVGIITQRDILDLIRFKTDLGRLTDS